MGASQGVSERHAAPATVADAALLGHDGSRRLLEQIEWFNRLRFLAVVGMLAAAGAADVFGLVADTRPLYALTALTFLVNVLYVVRVRAQPRKFARTEGEGTARRTAAAHDGVDVRRLRRHVDVQIGVDLLILTALLHFSGGVTNPLVLFYIFHSFIAALLLSLRAAVIVAAVSMALLGALGVGEYTGVLPHHPLEFAWVEFDRVGPIPLALWLTSLALTIGFSVYLVANVVRQLGKRDQELVGLSRQLAMSEKLASIGTLASGVSHEINNPVGVILSKTRILRYRIEDRDPPEALLSELDTIEKHTRRIGGITEGLLAFSRETPFEMRALAIGELVQEAADLVKVPFRSAEIGLDVRLDPSDPWVQGSPNHLLQVLVNVLLNARDASPPGSRVAMTVESDAAAVRIAIADTGQGIPPAVLPKIFDPFFTTKDVDRGTGLGLALSHGIVQRHQGRILAETEVGVGSTFTIELPLAARPSEA